MGARHLSPDNPVSAGLLVAPLLRLLLHTVDVRHPLAQVIICLFPLGYTIHLEEGGVRVLVTSAPLIPNKYSLIVQPASQQMECSLLSRVALRYVP